MKIDLDVFFETLKRTTEGILATSANDKVTMRGISIVPFKGAILCFTNPTSLKYMQLKENPFCCFNVGEYFVEAKAVFLGSTMKEENQKQRKAYAEKFLGAFDENEEFGGISSEFIEFKLIHLKTWKYKNGIPIAPIEHFFSLE